MAGNIKGITIEFNGDATKLDRALRSIRSETKSVDAQLKDVDRALKFNPKNTELLAQKQSLLKQKIKQTENQLKEFKDAQAQLDASGVEKTSNEYMTLRRDIIKTESKLKTFNKQLEGSKKFSLKGVSDKITKVGKGMTKGVTAPLVAVGVASAKAFSEVDEGMDTVVKKTGASGKTLKSLQKSAQNVATSVPTSFQAAGNAIGEVNTRFHLTGKNLEDLSTDFIKFAEINDTDVVGSIAGTQRVMSAFGVDTKDAGKVLGVFTDISQKTGVSVDDLMDSLHKNGATFRDMGLDVQSAATLLGNFEAAGLDADTAMGSLKKAATNLQNKGIDVNEGLKDILSSLSDGKVTTKDYQNAVELFGKRGADAIVDAAKSGRISIDDLKGNLSSYSDTVKKTFKGTEDPIDKSKVIMNNLKVAGAEAFTSLQGIIEPVLDDIVGALKRFNKFWQKLSPDTRDTIIKIALIVGAVAPILIVIGQVVGAIGTIIGAISTIGGVIGTIIGLLPTIGGAIATFIFSPMGLIIGIILAVIAVGILLYKNWDKVKAAAKKLGDFLGKAFNGVAGKVKSAFNKVKNAMLTPIKAAAHILQGIVKKIKGVFSGIHIKLPRIKLPHFSVHGGKAPFGIAGKGSLPKFNISWYRNGGIFDSPSLIGVGEAGSEAALPLTPFWEKMDEIGNRITNGVVAAAMMGNSQNAASQINIQLYAFPNGAKMGEWVFDTYNKQARLKGKGRKK